MIKLLDRRWSVRLWPLFVVGTDAADCRSIYLHALGTLLSVVWIEPVMMGQARAHLSWRLFVVRYLRGIGLELVYPWEP